MYDQYEAAATNLRNAARDGRKVQLRFSEFNMKFLTERDPERGLVVLTMQIMDQTREQDQELLVSQFDLSDQPLVQAALTGDRGKLRVLAEAGGWAELNMKLGKLVVAFAEQLDRQH